MLNRSWLHEQNAKDWKIQQRQQVTLHNMVSKRPQFMEKVALSLHTVQGLKGRAQQVKTECKEGPGPHPAQHTHTLRLQDAKAAENHRSVPGYGRQQPDHVHPYQARRVSVGWLCQDNCFPSTSAQRSSQGPMMCGVTCWDLMPDKSLGLRDLASRGQASFPQMIGCSSQPRLQEIINFTTSSAEATVFNLN